MSVSGFFDAEAVRYDAAYDSESPAGRFLRTRLGAALAALGAGPGTVLDAGMGGGRLLSELDARGWTVTGVDSSPQMVELARRRLPHLADRLLEADAVALPFAAESFDAVVATGALEYVGDLPRGLAELTRVLRPGGRAVGSFPNYRSPHALWRRFALYPAARLAKSVVPHSRSAPMRPLHPITPAAFERALTMAGLRVGERRRIGPQLLFAAEKAPKET
jgi:ubiquinone/menaquinone biosynthesis C-methylase UbiE